MSDNDFFGGRRRRRAGAAFSPYSLFASGEQGVWYDPSDLTPEKVSWRRNLLTYSQDFENAAWTKSNASILSNLALYSQDFDNAWWFKYRGTLTANNATAPDGTTTADTWTEDTATGTHEINASALTVAANLTMTYQMRVKRSSGSRNFRITAYAGVDGLRAVFNLDTLVATNASYGTSTFVSASVVSIGSGWFLCTLTGSIGSANPVISFELVSGTSTVIYTGDGTSGLQFWGAQFLPGSTAQTYTRSLATAAPIQFADPLGGTLADKLVENTATTQHFLSQNAPTFSAGIPYTYTVYAKAAERFAFQIYGYVGAFFYQVNANLSAKTLTGAISCTPTLTELSDGWFRVNVSFVPTASGTGFTQLYMQAVGGGSPSYTGDGVSGIYVYGAQVEQASTASAYQRITDFSSDFLAAFPTHALYQESTGVTPVTALGQSVGLVLDKRLGALTAVQPISITNSTFTSGSTGWSSTNATLNTTVSGQIDVTSTSGAAFGVLEQAIVAPAGALIRVEVDCEIVSGTGFIGLWTGTTGLSTTFSDTGRRTRLFYAPVAVTNGSAVRFGGTATIGNTLRAYSVRASIVPGNHALQATSAARPTLQARSNLLTYTEQFDNAAWQKGGVTVTANSTIAPDGTTTADTLTSAGSVSSENIKQASVAFIGNGEKCISIYLRAGTATQSAINVYDNTAATSRHIVRVTWTGGVPTLSTQSGSGTLYPVESVGNSWYRISFSVAGVVAANANDVFIYPTGTATAAGSVIVWGVQAENSSTATTYQRVTTATDYADVGLPRNLTFDGIDDSLATAGNVDFATWTVGSRRNLLVNPTQFDAAGWASSNAVTVTANATTAPDGTATADLVIPTAVSALHYAKQSVTLANSTTYTISVYAKPSGYNWVAIEFVTGTAFLYANVNVSTGATGTVSGGLTTTVTNVGDGFYRITASGTTAATGTPNFSIFVDQADNTYTHTGNGTSGVYLWGAQLEVGSTATAFQDVGTDKVTLFSGVTKLSDAAQAVVTELGADPFSNNGSFGFWAPSGASQSNYYIRTRGTVVSNAATGSSYVPPITNVVTGTISIADDVAIVRVNALQAASSTSDQGTGNFGSYVLFVGRRNNATLPFNGRLFQLVIRGAATDSVTVGNAERWVGQLTGVAL